MSIAENISNIENQLSENVTLISVSKTRTLEELEEAYIAGARDFGENKVQELVEKTEEFHSDVRWHLIGHLQRNKVKYIVGKVHLIHSLDSIKLLEEIESKYAAHEKIANVLIQINIGRDPNKSGVLVEDLEQLINVCEKCNNVKVKGLMTIIPKGDEECSRKLFKKMKKIYDDLAGKQYDNIKMKYLSMGMTGDYKIAVSEGANMVRVGEGIFGKRVYKNI
ncbi:YggS family pyridoxal phosphate-dependent enzyme [Clostridium sp. ZS2-4]|uniref:YggS family pyridoxal phosphate-dependent enzyme n=1 Tax=Clostridium sp. ZS2-4 TaxID=2987703 RepID=UPI00227A5C2E|nr:YggS family pyridoxal phosphate-dependent enzyme [Clostridium sp. ZS2-4]MCY6354042.1 YggS family pyridoxal phosphate-dependent enzyme [Clostridium sp. ZS2-4]